MEVSGGTGTRRLLVAMCLATGITSIPNAAIVLALPTLHREFDASLTELEWTVSGFLLAYSAPLIVAGRLSDMFGRVRLLVIGTVVYMAASVVGALAGSALVLIVALMVAGVGGAILTPSSLAIITDAFRGARRSTAVAAWGAAGAFSMGIGPAIGGAFTDLASWRWILWLNVIVGALILLGILGARESRDEEAGDRIDFTGLALVVAGLVAITLALNEMPTWKLTSPGVLALLIGGAGLLALFVLVERRVRQPLVDIALFARRNLSGSNVVIFVLSFALGTVLFLIPVYTEQILGYRPLDAGLLIMPVSVAMVVSMPVGGRLYNRFGPVPPIIGGMLVAGLGIVLFSALDGTSDYSDVWLPLVLLGLGIGSASTPINLTALNAVETRLHGFVGGLMSMTSGLGSTFGVAVSGAVFEALQQHDTVDQAAAQGVTISGSTAATLEGLVSNAPTAIQALHTFPAAQRAALSDAVYEGWVSAMADTMLISLGSILLGLALTLLLIRREEPIPDPIPRPNVADPIPVLAQRP
jgi:EmrB/QacA subfamily drug resistance transporter